VDRVSFVSILPEPDVSLLSGIIESSAPTEKMDKSSWNGNLVDAPNVDHKVPLGMIQILLRVRNVCFSYFVCMFCVK